MHNYPKSPEQLEEKDLQPGVSVFHELSREELVQIIIEDSKNWLAMDGLWFQAVEAVDGMDKAIERDCEVWRQFSLIEARRIMSRLGLKPGGGIPALIECFKYRMYTRLNQQHFLEVSEERCVFHMVNCRVQEIRKRKGLDDFPCKPVGWVEYSGFAQTVDPRIRTRCIACPPDEHPKDYHCAWEFSVKKHGA